MNLSSLITDPYERKARYLPCLLVSIPGSAALAVVFGKDSVAIEAAVAFLVTTGVAFFFVQFVRRAGQGIEQSLYDLWDGMPTTVILRHRDSTIEPPTKVRYHRLLAEIVDGTTPVTLEEERADQARADAIYGAWSTFLRNQTRDSTKYNLVYEENINYGYARNCLGIKWWAVLGCLVPAGYAGWRINALVKAATPIPNGLFAIAGISGILLLFWLFGVRTAWVRSAAFAYAKRLIESTDSVQADLKKASNGGS